MESNNKLLCLNILGFKKQGISTEEYRSYMLNVHAPLVAQLMEKHGFLHWSMTHTPDESRQLMDQIHDAQFSNIAPYDCCVQLVFPDIECFVRMKADPFFKQMVGPDHEKFADTKRSQMMIGWFSPLMMNGKLVHGNM
ncbi:conidial pigment polyketide synthase PksP/Alb1 [Metarhizium guizhouense ARSEF 977]|uniref:Conidial pigment polyketide synthase PksP/Alb1 n=1 Tax=Metarhizium guizhouense (strain ARSEF 977) TaxID=1276136 RepID=A0A0B4GIT8_METGA|nr:conidial pigment polyketide synthase PksP/Alb1 [Metarhizium guizhouense ARSEF 977]